MEMKLEVAAFRNFLYRLGQKETGRLKKLKKKLQIMGKRESRRIFKKIIKVF